jgi:hypothetical protein
VRAFKGRGDAKLGGYAELRTSRDRLRTCYEVIFGQTERLSRDFQKFGEDRVPRLCASHHLERLISPASSHRRLSKASRLPACDVHSNLAAGGLREETHQLLVDLLNELTKPVTTIRGNIHLDDLVLLRGRTHKNHERASRVVFLDTCNGKILGRKIAE